MSVQKKKAGKKKAFLIIVVITVIAVIVIFSMQANREKTVAVSVEKVKSENLTSVISASGEVKPKKNINIGAHIPGRIVKIGVVEGQRVYTGDFLLKLDSTQYEANADRDKATIHIYMAEIIKAEARLKKDKKYFERQKNLYHPLPEKTGRGVASELVG
jgi:HlyD family secretion protein